MKVIIFAGGAGTRLWPLSRKKSPKQFEKMIGDKSTFQLTIERLLPEIKYSDIYISTNANYKNVILEQVPQIPEKNIIFEPEKKDVAPAVALSTGILSKIHSQEPVLILWSDHMVKNIEKFKRIIKSAAKCIEDHPNKIIFIAHKPRFASQNLGYIRYGKKINECKQVNFHSFVSFVYRPNHAKAKQYFASQDHAWNLGYFMTTPQFIQQLFKTHAPDIYNNTNKILSHYGKKTFNNYLKDNYGKVDSISFDNAVLEKINTNDAVVIVEDIGWSDVGSWEALKEALEHYTNENVIRGKVHLKDSKDCLIYNYDEQKIIVGVDLGENIIINVPDAILIAKKTSMPKVKKIVEGFAGTQHESLT